MDQFKYKNKIFNCEFFDSRFIFTFIFNQEEEGLVLNHYVDKYPLKDNRM